MIQKEEMVALDTQEECKFFYKKQENINPTPYFIEKYGSIILTFILCYFSFFCAESYFISNNIGVIVICFFTNYINIFLYATIRNYYDNFENFEFIFLEDKFIFKFESIKTKKQKNLKPIVTFKNLDNIKLTKNFLGQQKLELKGDISISYEILTKDETNVNFIKNNIKEKTLNKVNIPFNFRNNNELKELIEKYKK